MSMPNRSACCSITPVNLLTTEMWRTISGSRISFWSFRKGYSVSAGFSPTRRDHWSGIYSLELFLILFHLLFFFYFYFFPQGCLTPTHVLQGKLKLLTAFANQSSAMPRADFTHHFRGICNSFCSWAHHLHNQLERRQSHVWFTWQLLEEEINHILDPTSLTEQGTESHRVRCVFTSSFTCPRLRYEFTSATGT